ncbi:unnamed protein product [Darwinula stevensoni]|uniref:Uncharacterized protein n=1 Tax=Darwinula stevensoni TaxID=69355 RepID=A0A7R9A3J7_9CRUS|nr:unnamed protein product [Darwinula stevensoni]CAG0881431.1 unnamed protein product [Darwinula stevensoni]
MYLYVHILLLMGTQVVISTQFTGDVVLLREDCGNATFGAGPASFPDMKFPAWLPCVTNDPMQRIMSDWKGYLHVIAALKCRSLQRAEIGFSALTTVNVYPVPIDTPWCHLEHPTPFLDPSTLLDVTRAWAAHEGLGHVFILTDEENEIIWKYSLLPELMRPEDIGFTHVKPGQHTRLMRPEDIGFTHVAFRNFSLFPWERLRRTEGSLMALLVKQELIQHLLFEADSKGMLNHFYNWLFVIPNQTSVSPRNFYSSPMRLGSRVAFLTYPQERDLKQLVSSHPPEDDFLLWMRVMIEEPEIRSIGFWSRSQGQFIINATKSSRYDVRVELLRITAIHTPPFVYVRNDSGLVRFEGFLVDVVNHLSQTLNFTYEYRIVADGKFGSQNENGSWNGIVGEVMNGKADLGLANLARSMERETVVHFPSVDVAIERMGMVIRRPGQDTSDKLLIYVRPFNLSVWLVIGANLILFGVVFGFASRIYDKKPVTSDALDFENAFWIFFGFLVQQGHPREPRWPGRRMIFGSYWLSCVVMFAAYSGILASYFTVTVTPSPINSLEDLVSSDYKFGFPPGSIFASAFNHSKDPTHKEVYQQWLKFQEGDQFVKYEAAPDRLSAGGYAFISDLSNLEHMMMSRCDLMLIKVFSMQMNNGIILQKNSQYASAISSQ